MTRGRHGGTILLLVIMAIGAFAILAMAEDTEASWSGEPLPPWGGDWTILSDTIYTDETIRLDGDILIEGPSVLSLDGCTLIFNSSSEGEHGIEVKWSSVLYINDTGNNQAVVKSNASSDMWFFYIEGTAYLDGAELKDLVWGIDFWGTYLWVEGCTIWSEYTGIYAYGDAHIGNSTINVRRSSGIGSIYTYGVYLNSGDFSVHNLVIDCVVDVNESRNSSGSYYGYYRTYGLYLYSASVGRLEPDTGKEFSISIDVDYEMWNDNTSTSYLTFYNRFYSYGMYLYQGSSVEAIGDIDISFEHDILCVAPNATMGANYYVYDYSNYIYSYISSAGESPSEIYDLTISGAQRPTVHTFGGVYRLTEYIYSRAIYINDPKGAQPDDVVALSKITIKDSVFDIAFQTPRYGNWEMMNCTFENLEVNRVLYLYYTDKEFLMHENTFTGITALNALSPSENTALIYMYYTQAEGNIFDNTFSNIEGIKLIYIRENQAEIIFEENLFTDNRQIITRGDSWIYMFYIRKPITFRWNTFEDSSFSEGMVWVRYFHDTFTFDENTVVNCDFGDYMLRVYDSYGGVSVAYNDITDNTGPLFQSNYIRRRYAIEENVIENNAVGTDYLILSRQATPAFEVTNNEFTNNSADRAMILVLSTDNVIIDKNVFLMNTASSALDGGILMYEDMDRTTATRRNVFTMNTGNCINFNRPNLGESDWVDDVNFIVDGNEFYDNDGTATTWVDFRSFNIEVKRNIGSGNIGPLMYHTITSQYTYDDSGRYEEMTGPNLIEITSNNYSYNLGGAIDIDPAQYRDAITPYNNPYQKIKLSNNILRHNSGGWDVRFNNFGEFPIMVNNVYDGSTNGVFLRAIYPGLWERPKITFLGQSFDGGPNGVTAWGLVNVDADFTDCSFTNFTETIYARDCTVNVYWSAIPENSGKTEGRGYIYVWNNMEILITWGDATGADSGILAQDATLALLGTNGRYFGALKTNTDGRIGPMLISPWSSVEGRNDQWSPFDGTIIYGGVTDYYVINAIGEHVGENSLHLILYDKVVPEVVVTSPSMGAISNLVDMPVEGFLFETGSGIESFMGYLDGGEGIEIDPDRNWLTMFEDLDQGEHTLFFEAVDTATNNANATLTFVIDAFSPDLDIVSPVDNLITREQDLLVQGSYEDDVSDVSEIVVRLNGVPISSTTGVINEYVTLTEGVNTIIVDATDGAGNRQIIQRIVTLDSYPPTLYVYTPLNQLVTNNPELELNGLSEGNTPIIIEQVRASDGVLILSKVINARGDGIFKTDLTLEEGTQHIVFTAEDPAANVRTITRTVTLDTTPPGLTINSPAEGDYINLPTVDLVGQVLDDNPEAVRVLINGIPIDHTALISVKVPLVEGRNTITVIAIDTVDNQAVRMVNVTRDTILPELILENPEFVLTNAKILIVRGFVNDDAELVTVAGVPVNVDEDFKFVVEIDLSTTQSPIEVVAIDKANNEAQNDIEFIYDAEKPNIVLTDQPDAKTPDLVIMINGTVTDNQAAILLVTVRGAVYPVVDGKFNVLLTVDTSGEGWNNFTVSATDDAGNTDLKNVNVQYVAPPDGGNGGPVTEDENLWWYVGLLFIIAALVIIATVFIFAKRGEEE